MTITNLHILIPFKLDIDEMNYSPLTYFFEHLCKGHEILDHIIAKPTDMAETSNPMPPTTEWLKIDSIILSWTFTTLAKTLQSRLVVEAPQIAKEAWDLLAKNFQDNKCTRSIALKAELRSLKLGNLSIDAYFQKIESIDTILKGLGSPLSNEDVVNISLEGLPTNLSDVFNLCIYLSVSVGDSHSIPVINSGHSLLPTPHRPLHLNNILITPNIVKNLIYVHQFVRDNYCAIEFNAFGFSVKDSPELSGAFPVAAPAMMGLAIFTQSRSPPTLFILFSLVNKRGTNVLDIQELKCYVVSFLVILFRAIKKSFPFFVMLVSLVMRSLGWLLEEIHVTWAHLEKKRTRLQLYTKSLEENSYSDDGFSTSIHRREVHRVPVFNFRGLPDLMAKGLTARMLMEHHDDQGVSMFTNRAWRGMFDIRGPLVHDLILEFYSTFRFGQAILDLDTPRTL
ncbi:hybrid signal transduction histidine kinase M [Tanacetum coccineum]